jgi:hypothetical protein
VRYALLVLDRQKIDAIQLPDGSLTRDAVAALECFPPQMAPASTRMPQTPARIAKLNELTADGKVSDRNAKYLVDGDRVNDAAWRVVEAIATGASDGHVDVDIAQLESSVLPTPSRAPTSEAPAPAQRMIPASRKLRKLCWTARLYVGTGEIPTNFDPLQATSRNLPAEPLLRLLDKLSEDGWRIVHTSEDRTVADATSYVIAVRYLLTCS